MSSKGPNPLLAGWSMLRAMRVRRPNPTGDATVSHHQLDGILALLREEGVPGLLGQRDSIAAYRTRLAGIDPDSLPHAHALAFWVNLYNAGALDVAAETTGRNEPSVLRVPGAFRRPWVTVAGEALSLDDIEHGKIRRFKDPRIHGALVCGSASCPTLRYAAYRGADLDKQLDDQMRRFLKGGGAVYDPASNRLELSRVFLWFGADFVRPHRMPAWLPSSKRAVARAVSGWLDPQVGSAAETAAIGFQSYDWGLACAIG